MTHLSSKPTRSTTRWHERDGIRGVCAKPVESTAAGWPDGKERVLFSLARVAVGQLSGGGDVRDRIELDRGLVETVQRAPRRRRHLDDDKIKTHGPYRTVHRLGTLGTRPQAACRQPRVGVGAVWVAQAVPRGREGGRSSLDPPAWYHHISGKVKKSSGLYY